MNKPAALWGATIGAVLAYTAAALMPSLPTLHFFPRPGSWGLLAIAGEPSIRWYGLLIYLALGGLTGSLVGRVINRRPPWALVWLMAAVSLLVLVWDQRQWFLK